MRRASRCLIWRWGLRTVGASDAQRALLLAGGVDGAGAHDSLGAQAMKSIYFESDDTLHIHLSDKPIVREVSQDWHINISYAEDGTIVEIVLLDAKKEGCCLLNSGKRLNSVHGSQISVLGIKKHSRFLEALEFYAHTSRLLLMQNLRPC